MNAQELENRQRRAQGEPLIIAAIDGGYRVHSPTAGGRLYEVRTDNGRFSCTCPDFTTHTGDPDWRCKHVLAVESRMNGTRTGATDGPEAAPAAPDPYDSEERAALQAEAGGRDVPEAVQRTVSAAPNGGAQMLLKRSVSPDGKINSLSVEFALGVDHVAAPEIDARAGRILKLQDGIVRRFLNGGSTAARPGNGRDHAQPGPRPTGNGAMRPVPAVMIGVVGGDTKFGRRLHIDCQVNGKTLRLYGSRKQLAAFIERAGYAQWGDRIEEGMRLNLPCSVTTKPSSDGRFVNVEEVFPAEPSAHRGRR